MSTEPRILVTGFLFLFTFISGVWLSNSGKPINIAILTILGTVKLDGAARLAHLHVGNYCPPDALSPQYLPPTSFIELSAICHQPFAINQLPLVSPCLLGVQYASAIRRRVEPSIWVRIKLISRRQRIGDDGSRGDE